jgi:hypothetical protein
MVALCIISFSAFRVRGSSDVIIQETQAQIAELEAVGTSRDQSLKEGEDRRGKAAALQLRFSAAKARALVLAAQVVQHTLSLGSEEDISVVSAAGEDFDPWGGDGTASEEIWRAKHEGHLC